MLDDGVNDAWYKSECGQACGFGGEKFKWLVRMVLLHPFIPTSRSSFSISLAVSRSRSLTSSTLPDPKTTPDNPAPPRLSFANLRRRANFVGNKILLALCVRAYVRMYVCRL